MRKAISVGAVLGVILSANSVYVAADASEAARQRVVSVTCLPKAVTAGRFALVI